MDQTDYGILEQACKDIERLESECTDSFRRLVAVYSPIFPELQTLPLTPVQYGRLVQLTLSSCSLSSGAYLINKRNVDYGSILPGALSLAIAMAASTSSSSSESMLEADFSFCRELSTRIIQRDVELKQLFVTVENASPRIAPNLSVLVGPRIAALMLVAAGGLQPMTAVPAGNIGNLGAKAYLSQVYSTNLSTLPSTRKYTLLELTDTCRNVPAEFVKLALRLLSNKVVLAIRADATHTHQDGSFGRALLEDCQQRLQERSDPAPLKEPRPLPIPQALPRKRRGGKRARKQKQLRQRTEIRTLQNRLPFNVEEDELIVGDSVKGLGMLSTNARRQRVTNRDHVRDYIIRNTSTNKK